MAQEAIATVSSISGRAQARNAEGELRELKVGDTLLAGETVVTPDGGTVELALSDGSPLTVSGVPEMAITRDLVAETAAGADESAVEDETVQQVLAALESGDDLGDVLPATAAGVESISGVQGEGHSWIRLGRIDETTSEFSGMVGSIAEESEAIEDENPPPVDAIDDFATTEQGVPVVINVLPNDDFQLGANVISVTNGEHGTVVINSDNTVTYSPDPDFSGEDVFTYTAVSADGTGQDTANVTVVIPEVPVIPPPPIPEPLPTISIDDMEVTEGETATLTISLSKAWDETITVQYRTADDTAQSVDPTFDYDPVTQLVTVTFLPGETSKEVTFSTNVDNIQEAKEQFLVNLSNPTNAVIADPTGIVEINDDFTLPPPIIPPPPPPPPGDIDVASSETTRDEVDLPSPTGRSATPGELSKTGSFTVLAEDGLATLKVTFEGTEVIVVNGGAFQGGVLQMNLDGDPTNEVTIVFDSMTGPVNGEYTINLTATLNDTISNDTPATADQITVSVEVQISDIQGDLASGTRTVIVLDDAPVAAEDIDYTDPETGQTSGNVVTGTGGNSGASLVADESGADGFAASAVVGVATSNMQVTNDAGVGGIASAKGTLTVNADGSYTYVANEGASGPDVFYYTIADADGDFSTTSLTINLENTPVISNLTPSVDGGDVSVDEDDLVDGSDDTKEPTTVSGTFNVSSPDGVENLSVGGAFIVLNGVEQALPTGIVGAYGTLDITGYDGSLVTYEYTLTGNTEDHTVANVQDSVFDDFAVFLDDPDGNPDEDTDTLSIEIIDDVPFADGDGLFTTGKNTALNNIDVLGDDTQGADGVLPSAVTLHQNAANGDVTVNPDGTFNYTPDLDYTGSDSFQYKITDGDGDESIATVTLKVNAEPQISNLTPSVDGGDVSVDEDDLVDGSDDTKEPTTVSGTFNVSSPDGVENLSVGGAFIVLNGVEQALPTGIVGAYGTLDITGYDGSLVTYEYTLTGNTEDHTVANVQDSVFDDFAVFLDDPDGNPDEDTDTLSIEIIDDVPFADGDGLFTTGKNTALNNIDVLGDDTQGADGVLPSAVTLHQNAANGDVTVNPDGTFNYTPDLDYTGSDSFQYKITDGDGDESIATVTLKVNAEPQISNLTPSVDGGDVSVDEDDLVDGSDDTKEPTTVSGTFNVSSPDGVENLSVGGAFIVLNGVEQALPTGIVGAYGTLDITGYDGSLVTYEYTLTGNTEDHTVANVQDSVFDDFAVFLDDPDGNPDEDTDTLSIEIIDDVPFADGDGLFTTGKNTALNNIDVLGDDTQGADGVLPSAVTLHQNAANGDVTVNPDGTFNYTPDLDYTGSDSFQYKITDGDGDESIATVTLKVNAEPQISNLTPSVDGGDVSVDEDDLVDGSDDTKEPTTVSGTFNVSSPDGVENLSVGGAFIVLNGVEQALPTGIVGAYGTLDITGYDGSLVTYEYTLTGNTEDHTVANVQDSVFDDFAVFLDDPDGNPDEDTDTLSIEIIDDVPFADGDGLFTTGKNTALNNIDVLGDDTQGADGVLPSAVTLHQNAANGDVTVNPDGTFNYTPDLDYTGSDSFQYKITDGDGDESIATVTLKVNAEPQISNLTPSVDGGDVSVDEDDLVDGSDDTKEPTTVSGTFNVSSPDGVENLSVGGAFIVLNGVEQALPTGIVGAYGTLDITGYDGSLVTYEYTLTGNTEDHTVANVQDSVFDDFAVFLDDPDGNPDEDTDTLSIEIIDDVPFADGDGLFTTGKNTALNNIDVLGDDTQGADGVLPSAVTLHQNAANGDVTVNPDGTFNYTPDLDYTGSDSFQYKITDGDGDESIATVTLKVNAEPQISNLTPSVDGGDVSVDEDDLVDGSDDTKEPTTVSGTFNVSSPDGVENLSVGGAFIVLNGVEQALPTGIVGAYGTLDITGYDGSLVTYEYTLTGNTEDHTVANVQDSVFDDFAVFLDDPDGNPDEDTDTLSIEIIDDVPFADGDGLFTTGKNTALNNIDVLGDDTQGADGVLPSAVTLHQNAANGDVTVNPDGTFNYTPDLDYTGSDSFQYKITDGDGDESIATVTLRVNAEPQISNLTPSVDGGDVSVDEDDLVDGSDDTKEPTTVSGTFNVSSPDGVENLSVGGAFIVLNGVEQALPTGIVGAYGTLDITGYDGSLVTYEYTLTGNTEDHTVANVQDSVFDDFAVFLDDPDGNPDEDTDTLSIEIIDDVPQEFTSEYIITWGGNAPQTKFVTFWDNDGADGYQTPEAVEFNEGGNVTDSLGRNLFLENNQLVWHLESPTSLVARYDAGGGSYVEGFTVTLINGTDEYSVSDVSTDIFTVQGETVPFIPAEGANGGNNDYYGLMNLGGSEVDAVFSSSSGSINTDSEYFGVASNWIEPNQDIELGFYFNSLLQEGSNAPPSFDGAPERAGINNFEILISEVQGAPGGYADFTVTVYLGGALVDTFDFTGVNHVQEDQTFTLSASGIYDTVVIQAAGDTTDFSIKPEGFNIADPSDIDMKVDVTGYDGDGDSAAGELVFGINQDDDNTTIDPAPVSAAAAPAAFSAPAAVVEDSDPDPVVQSATEGADTLLGTDGSDVFAWSLADNSAEGDSIIDFDDASDSINIADILEDTTDTADFSSYLEVGVADDGVSTVIKVSNSGDFENAEQTITVEGVNLVDGVDLDDSLALNNALQSLVDAGKLVTE